MREMTGRERAIRAMDFEMTDRLPIMANGIWSPKMVMRLAGVTEDEYWANQPSAHYKACGALGMDFFIQKAFPQREESEIKWALDENARWGDPDVVADDLERLTREHGAQRKQMENTREGHIADICDYQARTQDEMGDDLLWVFGMDAYGPAIIDFPYGLYGYEGFFLAFEIYPDVMEKYWIARSEMSRIHNECVVEAAKRLDWPKIGYLGHDFTDQRGNMVSPAKMGRLFFPHLDYAVQPLVKAGFKLVWHSDGNMDQQLRPLIDIGISGFQGFQEECGTKIIDVAKLRATNGDPLILWGSCSTIRVLIGGDEAAIRNEVNRVLTEWPHPGLCLATSSYLSPDIPEGNIETLYKHFRELGKGRCK